jgi:Fe-S cluster assembly scaffold protein SufB
MENKILTDSVIEKMSREAKGILSSSNPPKFRRFAESFFEPSWIDGLPNFTETFDEQIQGVNICDIHTAKTKYPDALDKCFGQIVPLNFDKASVLHYAHITSGILVYVPDNAVIEEPVMLAQMYAPHMLIYVGKNAEVTFVDDNSEVLSAIEIEVMENAKVNFVCADFVNDVNIATRRAIVERQAVINWYIASFNSIGSYTTVQSHVVGEGGESNINWVFYGKGYEKFDIFAGNIFDAPNCKGEILVKGVVSENSKASVVGEIDITLKGGGTDSYLKEDLLMLDKTAKVDAIPSLEIKTNDVKAGHGVAVEKLTDDKLFYLMARGISRDEAKKLMLEGFLKSLYADFPSESLVDNISKQLSL